MSAPAHESVDLGFAREEAWVAHAAVEARTREAVDADEDTSAERGLLRALEAGRPLGPAELRLLRETLVDYLADAPLRDRAPGREALRAVRSGLDG